MYTVIAAFCTAYYFVNVAGFHMNLKRALKMPGRLKPFDCVQCLSVWFAVAFYFLPLPITQFFAIIFLTGFIATKIK